MSEGKHTKGLWIIKDNGYGDLRVMSSNGLEIAEVSTAGCHEDARLIAAAPDMLEALRDAIQLLDMEGYSTKEHCAAISKATGQ